MYNVVCRHFFQQKRHVIITCDCVSLFLAFWVFRCCPKQHPSGHFVDAKASSSSATQQELPGA